MSGIELHTEDPQDTRRVAEVLATVSVSYTHLTLPTILLV